MVTGGLDGFQFGIEQYWWNRIATTEVLRLGDDAWTFVGNLPRQTYGLRGVNLGSRLLMIGTDSIDKIVV